VPAVNCELPVNRLRDVKDLVKFSDEDTLDEKEYARKEKPEEDIF
jgi:hypothetical protein